MVVAAATKRRRVLACSTMAPNVKAATDNHAVSLSLLSVVLCCVGVGVRCCVVLCCVVLCCVVMCRVLSCHVLIVWSGLVL